MSGCLFSVCGLSTVPDPKSLAKVNQASLSVLNGRTAGGDAVFSAVLCAWEAIKLAKYFIFKAVAIRIGDQSYSISHCLFSFASVNGGSLRASSSVRAEAG